MALDLSELNKAQREAVLAGDGPLLILAGAGSGKTRTLVYRVASLIDRGTTPHSILTVTFTNKAAKELQNRVRLLLGDPKILPWVGTFHGFCAWLLRREHGAAGLPATFSIYDASDQLAAIKRVIANMGATATNEIKPQAALSHISSLKDELVSPETFAQRAAGTFENAVARIYPLYQDALRASGALDFDDLIVRAVHLLSNKSIGNKYSERFRHILIDEYQDTNHAQYRLVALLSSSHDNVTAVGDDDQSIYTWRGADIRNILEFEKDFPDAKVITLDRNYRSTPQILTAASAVVAHNEGRKPKTLWTDEETGDLLSLIECDDERDEASRVAVAFERILRDGTPLSDMTILYRTNAQSRVFEDEFRRRGMPYTIVGGIRFYERAEVKDVLAYLRLLVNPNDEEAFRRVVNVPARGIGPTTLSELDTFRREHGLGFLAACSKADEVPALRPTARQALSGFGSLIDNLRDDVAEADAGTAVRAVLDRTAYLALLADDYDPVAVEKSANVREISAAAAAFAARSEDTSLAAFLEEVSLLTNLDRYDPTSGVTLMTAHSAKGLEFRVVCVAGLEEGLFPLTRDDDPSSMEEERRLFYVCLTRAQKQIFLSHARTRRRFGPTPEYQRPSRFLSEIPSELCERSRAYTFEPEPRRRRTPRGHEKESVWEYESQEEIVIVPGRRVRHPIFGEGTVEQVEGSGPSLRLTVRFGSVKKRLVAAYAGLEFL